MTQTNRERIVYLNGQFLAESRALIPFRDRSFRWGDGCYDMARTFKGKPFKLRDHVDRLYRSLAYLEIELPLTKEEMIAVSEEVLARNSHLLTEHDDYWICQRISRGIDAVGDEKWDFSGPTIVVECIPLPLAARAPLMRDGIELLVSSIRRTPAEYVNPRAKLNNYLNLVLAEREVMARNPNGWALLLDATGNIAEGTNNNFFLVKDNKVLTAREQFVLPGVSRQTVIDVGRTSGIEVIETDINLYDAFNADEAFITNTSLCICPVRSINNKPLAAGRIPGPVTSKLIEAYSALAQHDFVAQYLWHLQGDHSGVSRPHGTKEIGNGAMLAEASEGQRQGQAVSAHASR